MINPDNDMSMKETSRYMRSIKFQHLLFVFAVLIVLATMFILTGCERRELYVYGDEYHSVTLDVDWRNYSSTDPDGMTYWFYPLNDPSHKPYTLTTANVRHHDLYLPGGLYEGVIIDYSPDEYSRQRFLGLDSVPTARVEATPAAYQPDTLIADSVRLNLYGEPAWTETQQPRPAISEDLGLYTVANEPEEMALDTLENKRVYEGEYGDYIPWKEREDYQSTLTVQHFYSWPESIIWKLRIRVWIKQGFNYLWNQPASITGMADGHFLALDKNNDKPCLLGIDGWELQRTGDNEGYVAITLSTFGLRPSTVLSSRTKHGGQSYPALNDNLSYDTGSGVSAGTRAPGDVEPSYNTDPDWHAYWTGNCLPEDVRLNLSFTLRDHATALFYHFNVGHRVVSYDAQQVLRIDLGPDFFKPGDPNGPDPIILPYVEPYNGAGFDAVVTPWEDEEPVDVPM